MINANSLNPKIYKLKRIFIFNFYNIIFQNRILIYN